MKTFKEFIKESNSPNEFWWISDEKIIDLIKDFRKKREEEIDIRIDDSDPYGEEDWADENPNQHQKFRKSRIKLIIDLFEDKWKNTARGKAKEFIEYYPNLRDFNDEAIEDIYQDEEEINDEINSDDEVYTLSKMDIIVGNKIGDRSSGYGVTNVTTGDWCDFFNSLVEAGW